MLNIFKKKKSEEIHIYAPIKGEAIQLDQVPDPVFAQKMVGDGVAINPAEGVVYSPVDGEIVQIFDTKHAIGINGPGGIEILIHVGLDTVNLKGEGFTAHVKSGDKVKRGQKLLEFDLEVIRAKAKGTVTPVLITNPDKFEITKSHGQVGNLDFVIMEVKEAAK